MLDIDSPYEAGPPSLLWRARTALAEVDSRTGAAVFGLLLALAAAVGADRALVRAGEINLRIELLFGVLISVCAVAYLRRQALKVVGYLDWLLLGWVGLNIMASLAFSPSPIDSVRAALVLPGLFAIYLAVNLLVRGMGAANLAALLFVCVGAAVSLVGLVGSILFTLTGATGGISLHRVYEGDVLTVVPLVSSTIWEPNLFGALALCTGLLAGALTFAPSHEQQRGRTVLLTCVALCYAGAVLSMTRTVWLVGLMLTLALATVQPILSARKGALYRPIWLATALVGVIVGAAAAASMPRVAWKTADPWELAYDQLEERVTLEVLNLGSGTKGVLARNSALAGRVDELAEWENAPTILARQSANRQAIELWKERP